MSSSRKSARARRLKGDVGRTGARFPRAAEPDAKPAATPDPPKTPETPEPPEPEQHFVDEVPPETEPEKPEEEPAGEEAVATPTVAETAAEVEAAEGEPHFVDEVPPETEPEGKQAQEIPEQVRARLPVPPVVTEEPEPDDVRSWVRPYVWTGGRTTTSMEFAVETMVSAKDPESTGEVVRDEHRQVLQLCAEPRSVSEIAALLSVPLGAAKALLGVMAEEDLLVVHRTSGGADGPDLELMERVLRGLRKL